MERTGRNGFLRAWHVKGRHIRAGRAGTIFAGAVFAAVVLICGGCTGKAETGAGITKIDQDKKLVVYTSHKKRYMSRLSGSLKNARGSGCSWRQEALRSFWSGSRGKAAATPAMSCSAEVWRAMRFIRSCLNHTKAARVRC